MENDIGLNVVQQKSLTLQKIQTIVIQTKYTKKFNLPKRDWENLYPNKIYRIKDRKELQTLNTN